MNITRISIISAAIGLLQACSHPLEIVGEGDIVDLNHSGHGCSLEEYRNGAESCTLNLTVGDYDVNYHPVPRPGWEFVRWEGPCGPESVAPNCELHAPANIVQEYWYQVLPATRAVFAQTFYLYAHPGSAGYEREAVQISVSTDIPSEVISSVSWSQLSGSAAVIEESDTLFPTLLLPSIGSDEVLSLQVDVTLDDERVLSAQASVAVTAYQNLVDVLLPDAALDACIAEIAAQGVVQDTGQLQELSCSGVSNLGGIDSFTALKRLELPNNQLTYLDELHALTQLEYLDLSGNEELSCNDIDELEERLDPSAGLLSSDLCLADFLVALGGEPEDLAIDVPRDRVYISVPERNEIVVVSLSEFRVMDRIRLSSPPYGIDISIDGTTLFAALNGKYYVASIDLLTRNVEEIPLAGTTGDPRTYDVVEGAPGRLFVSANPGSSGISYIAQVLLDGTNLASRVADNDIIRSRPKLARSPDQGFVYVGAGFSPNSLYRLSLATPEAPIILEDDHGSVYGTDSLALNASGTRIALSSGQVLRTGSFIEVGSVESGKSFASTSDGNLYVATRNGMVNAYDFESLDLVREIQTACDTWGAKTLLTFNTDDSIGVLQDDGICFHTKLSRSQPADPLADFRFPDIALEECVIYTAIVQGHSSPAEIQGLNCSSIPKTIHSLEDIVRLSSLENLDVSNSEVLDLSPLVELPLLGSLTARNTSFADLAPLEQVDTLAQLDVTGNTAVSCDALNSLAAGGVVVSADECMEIRTIELGGLAHDMVYEPASGSVFVSIPGLNQVSEIDLDLAAIVGSVSLPGQPRGIDLSADGSTIYAALYDSGDIAYVSRSDTAIETVDLSTELGDDRTWDIAEVNQDRLVVSSNPGSNGISYIVEVRKNSLGSTAKRVASNRIIRASPVFTVNQDQATVFVGSGFSPNSLYKLDAADEDLPIILEDDHGSVSGTNSLAVSPSGGEIYLRSGQGLDTDTFFQVQTFPVGRSTVTDDGAYLLIDDGEFAGAGVYDISTTAKVGTRPWGCSLINVLALRDIGDEGVLVLGDDLLCFSRRSTYE